jgi:endonuclease YncB( thermonuclease family)
MVTILGRASRAGSRRMVKARVGPAERPPVGGLPIATIVPIGALWVESYIFEPADAPAKTWPLVRVVDGDTAIIRYRPPKVAEERLRFLRIDTPEHGEPGFAEATEALKQLLGDGPVRLKFEEPGVLKRDNIGRLLAYICDAKGQNVNAELVRLGWSKFETKYGEGRLAAEFRKAEAEAIKANRGLWEEVPPVIAGPGDSFVPSALIIRRQ